MRLSTVWLGNKTIPCLIKHGIFGRLCKCACQIESESYQSIPHEPRHFRSGHLLEHGTKLLAYLRGQRWMDEWVGGEMGGRGGWGDGWEGWVGGEMGRGRQTGRQMYNTGDFPLPRILKLIFLIPSSLLVANFQPFWGPRSHQKQTQSMSISKLSRGNIPPYPPKGSWLHTHHFPHPHRNILYETLHTSATFKLQTEFPQPYIHRQGFI